MKKAVTIVYKSTSEITDKNHMELNNSLRAYGRRCKVAYVNKDIITLTSCCDAIEVIGEKLLAMPMMQIQINSVNKQIKGASLCKKYLIQRLEDEKKLD